MSPQPSLPAQHGCEQAILDVLNNSKSVRTMKGYLFMMIERFSPQGVHMGRTHRRPQELLNLNPPPKYNQSQACILKTKARQTTDWRHSLDAIRVANCRPENKHNINIMSTQFHPIANESAACLPAFLPAGQSRAEQSRAEQSRAVRFRPEVEPSHAQKSPP
ncbi:hypothetical protein M758_1G323200 [Ceratodon purpureus]|nr:hypothetical protein M758_1G323200 [Ceratodon purpureus]